MGFSHHPTLACPYSLFPKTPFFSCSLFPIPVFPFPIPRSAAPCSLKESTPPN
ncbi:hypothetical protein [Moorena producens]|uniref:hypothetical protein n=1 Tax=Moorena producens TaxID=1155739 RepID=UPI00131408BD|nr:hypothetical protein [Moorena producens]